MHRLLAKIVEIKKIGKRREGKFQIYTLSLKVKIKDIIPNNLKTPLKAKTFWITRDYPHPFEPKPKDEIVLAPEEIKATSDDEGIILKNEWMDVTILPHIGARIASLVYKGRDYFTPTLDYRKKGWVDVGGAFDLTTEDFPGTLCDAEFKEQETSKTHCILKYDKKGIEIIKDFLLYSSLPLLIEKTILTVKKKRDIIYSKYIPISIKDPETILFVPTSEKLEHRIYQRTLTFIPWHPFEYYGIKLGSFLIGDSEGCLLYTARKTKFLRARYSLTSFNIFAGTNKKELKKGESFTYCCIYALGDEYKIMRDLIAVKANIHRKTVILVRGTDKFSGRGRWNDKDIELTPIEIEKIGKLWVYLIQ
jgi:hypothetical protein